MKTPLLFAALCAATFALAQAEPGTVSAAVAESADESEFSEAEADFAADALSDSDVEYFDDGGTDSAVSAFMEKKGWSEGANWTKDGSLRIIASGSGNIGALPSNPAYGNARSMAFTKALLEAKHNMSTYLETEIEQIVSACYSSPGNEAEQEQQAQRRAQLEKMAKGDGLFAKTLRLAHKKLDDALRKEGVDVAGEQAAAQAELDAMNAKAGEIIRSDTFRQSIAQATRGLISGVQVCQSFEAQPDGMNGEIAVVIAWSPLLAETAACMVSHEQPPTVLRKRGKPVREQLPKSAREWIGSFGVRQMIDENGQFVLVSFAQASPRSMSRASQQSAKRVAQQLADAQLREFAGETYEGAGRLDRAESITEFDTNPIPEYKFETRSESYRKSISEKMAIQGISSVGGTPKGVKPPASGSPVYVAARMWSPRAASIAREVKKQMNASAQAGATGGRVTPKPASVPKAEPTRKGGYVNSGAEADDDAF